MNLKSIAWLLLIVFVMAPAMSHAEVSCPWLNRATAAGVLNGSVSLTAQGVATSGDVCLFQSQKETTVYRLQIEVHEIGSSAKDGMPTRARCLSQAISLKGLGNEATMCAVNFRSFHGEQVIGRVRDKEFIIHLGSSIKKDPAMTSEMLQVKVKDIAQQVAGSLF